MRGPSSFDSRQGHRGRLRPTIAPMSSSTPAPSLLSALDAELSRHAPFSMMTPAHRRRFLESSEQAYFAPGEVVLDPASGPVTHLYCIRQGGVHGQQRLGAPGPFELGVGELFPVSALLGERPVTAAYQAHGDTFCLLVPAAVVRELSAASPPFADFLSRRMLQLLDLSQRSLQAGFAARALAEQSLAAPLSQFTRHAPLAVSPDTALGTALRAMQARHVGSVLVVGADGAALGILTRHDVLDRVVLAARSLDTPIAELMSHPVHTLTVDQQAHDAAMLMSREGVRHVPITDGVRIVGIVSERDLFALQRLSMRQLGNRIAAADSPAQLPDAAADIRRFATQLLAQGVGARQLTELVSRLNDRLTTRAVTLHAQRQGLDLDQACWLAFGSEGREEQTIASDQDNGLVFRSDAPARDRPGWLALGQAVNQTLADCGYPLCHGGVMAGQPGCCLTQQEWHERFAAWIEHGAPQDLLNASIYFDLRPLAGDLQLALPLREFIVERATATPRFIKQMALNALSHRAPLNWYGALSVEHIDLKLQGTAIFVESARLLALATGVDATATRKRLEAAAARLGVPAREAEAWVAGFEYLQLLRLGEQAGHPGGDAPNRCEVATLNEIDRRVLRETLRVSRQLQQRIELDYGR